MLRLWSSSSLNAAAEDSGSDPLAAPDAASAAPQTPSTSTPPLGRALDSASPWQRTASTSRSSVHSSPASMSRTSSPLRASPTTPRAASASDVEGDDSFLGRWEGDDSAELDADHSAQSSSRDVTSDSVSRQQFVFKPRPSASTERLGAARAASGDDSSRDQENVPVRHSPARQAPSGSGPRTPLSARPAHSMQHSSPQVPQTPRSDALRRGLLRRPATPGTGSSVRFGSRLYDDGNESRISNSTTLSDSIGTSPARTVRPENQSSDMSDSLLERMAYVARDEESNESIQAVELSLGASLSSADGPPDEPAQSQETADASTFEVNEGAEEMAEQLHQNSGPGSASFSERAVSPPSLHLAAIIAQDTSLSLSPPSGSVALASFDDMSALIDESLNGGPMALANQPSAQQWERMLPFGQQSPSARLDLAQATPRAPTTSTESAVSASGSLDSELSLSESYLAKQGNIAAQSVPAAGHSPSPRSNNSVQHSRFVTPSPRAAGSSDVHASASPRAYTSSPDRLSPSVGQSAPAESTASLSSDRVGARLASSPAAQSSSSRQTSSFNASATIRRSSASSSPIPATSSPLRSVVTRTPSPRSPARELDESVQSVGAAWATPNMSSATSAPGTGRTYHSVATPGTQLREGPSSASSSSGRDASSASHASISEASPSAARAARRPMQPQQASAQVERLVEHADVPASGDSSVENSMSQQAAALSAPMPPLDEQSTASPSLGRRRAGPRASDVALDQLLSAVTELDAVHSSRAKNILQRSYSGEQEASELRAALINSERGLAETLGAARKLQAAQREAHARILQLEQERLESAKRQAEVEELARRLKDQLHQEEHRAESEDVDRLREELANERRLRESERRDFEYRIWDAQRQTEPDSKPADVVTREAADSAVELARKEVQQACEMDADVRAYGVEVEHNRVVEELEARLAVAAAAAARDGVHGDEAAQLCEALDHEAAESQALRTELDETRQGIEQERMEQGEKMEQLHSAHESLQAELQTVRQQVEDANAAAASSKHELHSLREATSVLSAQAAALRGECDASKREVDTLREALDSQHRLAEQALEQQFQLEATVTQLREELDEARTRAQEGEIAAARVFELEETVKVQTLDLERARSEAEAAEDLRIELRTAEASHNSKAFEVTAALERVTRLRAESADEKEALISRLDESEVARTEAEAALDDLRHRLQELPQLRAERDHSQQTIQALSDEIASLREQHQERQQGQEMQVDELRRAVQEAQDALAHESAARSSSQQEIASTVASHRAEIKDLKRRLEAAQDEAAQGSEELRESKRSLTSQVADLNARLSETEAVLRSERAAQQGARDDAAQASRMLREMEASLKSETGARGQLKAKHAELEHQYAQLLNSISELEAHDSKQAQLLRDEQHAHAATRQRLSQQDQELSHAQSQRDDERVSEAESAKDEALQLAEEMQARLAALEAELEELRARNKVLDGQASDASFAISKLNKAKERLEEDNTNYSIALSAKQQELSLLKRNTPRTVSATPASQAQQTRASQSAAEESESGDDLPVLERGPAAFKGTRRRLTTDPAQHQVRRSVATRSSTGVVASDPVAPQASTSPVGAMGPPTARPSARRISVVVKPEAGSRRTSVSRPSSVSSSSSMTRVDEGTPKTHAPSSATIARAARRESISSATPVSRSSSRADLSGLQRTPLASASSNTSVQSVAASSRPALGARRGSVTKETAALSQSGGSLARSYDGPMELSELTLSTNSRRAAADKENAAALAALPAAPKGVPGSGTKLGGSEFLERRAAARRQSMLPA